MRAEDLTCIELLRTARAEGKATGDMSAELGEKLCAHQGFEELWEMLEKIVKDRPQMAPSWIASINGRDSRANTRS
jgi:hypothetical protein